MYNSGYLLIADISGYTNFVKLHNLRQKNVLGKIIADNFEFHAEAIVSDLLEAVIEVIEPTLKLNKLEGDVIEQIEIEAKYSGYLDRQRMDIEDAEKEEAQVAIIWRLVPVAIWAKAASASSRPARRSALATSRHKLRGAHHERTRELGA